MSAELNQLAFLAYYHAHTTNWTDWIAHRVVSAIIHSVIYGFVFKAMHHMTTSEAAVLVVVVLAVLFMWGRSQDRRGWVTR